MVQSKSYNRKKGFVSKWKWNFIGLFCFFFCFYSLLVALHDSFPELRLVFTFAQQPTGWIWASIIISQAHHKVTGNTQRPLGVDKHLSTCSFLVLALSSLQSNIWHWSFASGLAYIWCQKTSFDANANISGRRMRRDSKQQFDSSFLFDRYQVSFFVFEF